MDTVSYSVDENVGLVEIDNPPVNAAGSSVRTGLMAAMDALEDDQHVEAIAIYAAGRTFTAGADIKEFGKPPQPPSLTEVCNRIERCAKPVIAVLHGYALGGGLEIAMSAHARVGITGLRVGLPEVTLGIFPGAGGTQRAPRLVGVAHAIDMILSGRMISLSDALAWGLVDREESGTPREIAVKAAQDAISGQLQTRRTSEIDVTADPDAFEEARNALGKKSPTLPAPERALQAIEASVMPIAEGLERERALFKTCLESPERAGLVHAFFAERAVANIPEASATPREFSSVGVIGGGTMGSGIATSLLLAGLQVTLIEVKDSALVHAEAAIKRNIDGAVKRGKLDPAKADKTIAALTLATDLSVLADADLVIEAVFEDMTLKKEIFSNLDKICKPGAVLATNTSYLDIDDIAQATSRQDDVIGLHFFSPAHVMKLLEVVVPKMASPEAVKTGFLLGKQLKKICVRAGVCDGFIGNRILSHYRKCADYMMLDGTPPEQIDAALEAFGFAMGPYAVSDLAGLDIGWATRKRLAPGRHPNERYVEVADRICEQGWFGRKAGKGFYTYENGKRSPNAAVAEIIAAEQTQKGISPRSFSDDQIVDRYITAMVSEAARVVEDKIALRPIDVDAVFLFGYGFPRHHGGPLHYADQVGARELVRRIRSFAEEDPHYWQLPEIISRMDSDGGSFADMNETSA